jgi:ATP-dependent Clp protease ATP-binding subunit ClpC
MQIRISDELNTILLYARDEAMRTGSYAIGADHLMLGILRHGENAACLLLKELDVDLAVFKRYVDSCLFRERSVPYSAEDKMTVGRSAQNVINMAAFEALKVGSDEVRSLHLLVALSRAADTASAPWLAERGAGTREMTERLEKSGWRRAATVQTPAEEEVRETIESQVRSLVLISPSSRGGTLPS